MGNFFVPTAGSDDWKDLLASPEKHWRRGYSARSLASSWEEAGGFPSEIKQVFAECEFPILQDVELLLGFPEYNVPLPGGRAASQNDIFVLGKSRNERQFIAITVEGKVSEPFDVTMSEWMVGASWGKRLRLNYLCGLLELEPETLGEVRYQLLHRTASALILAERFNASVAMMLVHSFSQEHEWFEDYQQFLALFGQCGTPNSITRLGKLNGVETFTSWVVGNRRFLEA